MTDGLSIDVIMFRKRDMSTFRNWGCLALLWRRNDNEQTRLRMERTIESLEALRLRILKDINRTDRSDDNLPMIVMELDQILDILTPGAECPICLEFLSEHDQVLRCGHCFHKKCLTDWQKRNASCPSCRTMIF